MSDGGFDSERVPERPLRIQILTQYYDPEIGAPQIRLKAIAKDLISRRHQVDVVTALPNYPLAKIFEGYRRKVMVTEVRDGATVRRVWIHASSGSGLGRVLNFLTFAGMSLLPMSRTKRPDITLVESPPLFAVIPAMVDRFVRRRKYGLLTADLWPDVVEDLGMLENRLVGKLMYWLERRAYRRATVICPVTFGQVDVLRDRKHVPAEKIVLMHNGVDTELFTAGPPKREVADLLAPNGERVILYTGTHGYMHGLDVLLDAAPLVNAARPDAKIVMVGGGSERPRLLERVRVERIAGIEMLEARPLEDIAEMYRVAYAGVSTIRDAETLEMARPVKIFPIMASERPVIYAGKGEGAEIIANAGSGIVVPPEDPQALASAIIEILDDPGRAAEMGKNGRRLVEAEFSWHRIVGDFLEELERRL
jgi:colanic acid biosynthesis glycosyl transferase WcaI